MEFKFSKELYPKTALIKSAYSFTDRAYIHLDANEDNYIVLLEFKDGITFDFKEFENEMLAQTARYEVYRQTKDIRRLTVARALASTVIETFPADDDSDDSNYDIDEILTNWFDDDE